MITGCSVATPTIVYAWPTKDEFDKLAVEEIIHEWKPDRTETVFKNDGQEWERRCHSKTVDGSGVMVIFQWFDERPIVTPNAGGNATERSEGRVDHNVVQHGEQ